MPPPVTYDEASSSDEDEETSETRRSIKTAEKMHKVRFFINAKDQKNFEERKKAGLIRQEVLDFNETDDDEDPAASAEEIKSKDDAKKEKVVAKAEAKAAEEKAKADKEAEKKGVAAPATAAATPAAKPAAAGGLPPELAGIKWAIYLSFV